MYNISSLIDKLKILWIILIHFCVISCSYEQQGNIEVQKNINEFSIDSISEDNSQDLKDKIDYSISRLIKIIERNESRISDWELQLATADSISQADLKIDIDQMKNKVRIQKERLRRLKSKDD